MKESSQTKNNGDIARFIPHSLHKYSISKVHKK